MLESLNLNFLCFSGNWAVHKVVYHNLHQLFESQSKLDGDVQTGQMKQWLWSLEIILEKKRHYSFWHELKFTNLKKAEFPFLQANILAIDT